MFDLIALKQAMAAQMFSAKALAKKAGVDYNTLVKILNAKRNPTIQTIGKLARALAISPKELFKE